MRYARVGDSGLIVSRISFGCLTFGVREGSPIYKVDQETASAMVARAIDRGVNVFDTSNFYGGGASEEVLGRALRGRFDHVVLSSKAGFRVGERVTDAGLSRRHLTETIEGSLRRLGTDHIDLYLAHKEDPLTPLDETLRAFDDIVRSGKARYVGFSNWTAWRAAKAVERQRQLGLSRFVAGQIAYSLVQRDAEYDLLPAMADAGVGAFAWSPLAGGFLTGRYDRASVNAPGSRVATSSMPYDREQGLAVVEVLREIAAARTCTIPQAAIAWCLHRPTVVSAVVGVSRPDQLEDLLDGADLELTAEEAERLEAAAPLRPLYPHWHIASSHDRVAFDALGLDPPGAPGGAGRGQISAVGGSARSEQESAPPKAPRAA